MEHTTKVVNIFHEKCDVYIGRKGKGEDGYFGNPFAFLHQMKEVQQYLNFENIFIIVLKQMLNLRDVLKLN